MTTPKSQRRKVNLACSMCGADFVVPAYSIRKICHLCTKKQTAQVINRERGTNLTPGELERVMQEMVANETRMPWEKMPLTPGRPSAPRAKRRR